MWVLPVHHFVGLSKMRPHQELLKEGKLARYDKSMRAIFFFSHRKSCPPEIERSRVRTAPAARVRSLKRPRLSTTRAEWTSFDHPDPTGEQLRCMQRQVLKMMEGTAADVEPGFTDRMFLPSGASVSGAEWKRLLGEGHIYIWLDFSSVPVSLGVLSFCVRQPPLIL